MPICDLCAFPQDNGTRFCPTCSAQSSRSSQRSGLSTSTLAAQGQKCKQHPNVGASYICYSCGEPMCKTCDFSLPGNIHACPTCATSTKPKLSPKRRKRLVSAYVMASWCTLVWVALLSGVFRGMVHNKADQEGFGLLLMVVLLVPSITGVALGVSAKGRGSGTIAVWMAILWNGMILGGFFLLMLIGMMTKN